jgi:arylsulfatase A-like enzyme
MLLRARVLYVLLLLTAAPGAALAAGTRNVLLVTVDTLRADHLSSYGFALETSPRIDALAAGAALFERAVAASSSTAPSHASILTSLYTRQHSIGYRNGDTRLAGEPTLPEVLRREGYATGAFVSNVVLRRRAGLDRGFETYDDELPDAESHRPLAFERRARETTLRALKWLEEAHEPFFLWVHYQDPHGPYDAPDGYAERFELPRDPHEKPLPVLESSLASGGIPAYQVLPGLTLPSQYRARYAGEIRYADHWIGRLLDAPRVRDAIVVLTADHGESLGEGGRYFMHGTTTLPAEAHVPLLLRAPGIAPRRLSTTVSHVDILPTVLELVGVAAPDGVRGVALGPILRGEKPPPDRVVFCDMGGEASAYGAGAILRSGQTRFERLRWTGGEVEPAGSEMAIDEQLAGSLASYVKTAVPMVAADAPDPVDLERLRALGYLQ